MNILLLLLLEIIKTTKGLSAQYEEEHSKFINDILASLNNYEPSPSENSYTFIKDHLLYALTSCNNDFEELGNSVNKTITEQLCERFFKGALDDISINSILRHLDKQIKPTDDTTSKLMKKIDFINSVAYQLYNHNALPNIKNYTSIYVLYNYMFQAMRNLLGEEKFKNSSDVQQLLSLVKKIIGSVNKTIIPSYWDGYNKETLKSRGMTIPEIKTEMEKASRDIENGIDLGHKIIRSADLEGDDADLKRVRFLNAFNLCESLFLAFKCMIAYSTPMLSKDNTLDIFNTCIDMFGKLNAYNIFFAVPKKYMNQFIATVRSGKSAGNKQLYNFSIPNMRSERYFNTGETIVDYLGINTASNTGNTKRNTLVFGDGVLADWILWIILLVFFIVCISYIFLIKKRLSIHQD